MIAAQELHVILKQQHIAHDDAAINEMISQMDYHNNNKINYSEFLAATIDVQQFLTDSRLCAIFNQFDTDSSGKITAENIVFAMQKLGKQISQEEVDEMINSHDQTGDRMLNFAEFKNIFFPEDDGPH